MLLDPNVWGPNYWFFLHTIAITYPLNPTVKTKKIYYNFIHNFYQFIPDKEYSKNFIKILDDYPLTPYLDSRESFIRWVHFIHNKINTLYGSKNYEFTLEESMQEYYKKYEPLIDYKKKIKRLKQYFILTIIIMLAVCIIVLLYNK
tara:strand:+ start:2516 stop:2953 length:438 start_codon:yes stop_codon:yes gene_type:complete